jgi:hypothetical protein
VQGRRGTRTSQHRPAPVPHRAARRSRLATPITVNAAGGARRLQQPAAPL